MAVASTTPCPIPQPPGSVNGSYYGNNPPVPSPDYSLDDLFGNDLLDGQIIIQLSGTYCLHGSSFDTLLDRLQAAYPDSLWDATLLQRRLLAGKRAGRFCLAGNNTWVVNNNMVSLNFYNQRFQNLIEQITKIPTCQTTIATTFNGVYRGDQPRCGELTCGLPPLLGLIPLGIRQALIYQYRNR